VPFPHADRSSVAVPPADGLVTDERLAALLALAAEYDDLDFKRKLGLPGVDTV
jgi:hypothetical protein